MVTFALLAALMAGHPVDPSLDWPQPPEEMVDFLGRRRLCLDIPEPADRDPFDEEEWLRLSCSTLQREDGEWRSRYASDPDVRRWLDQDPRRFRLPQILISPYHGPPPADIRHVVLDGRARDTQAAFRLSIDAEASSNGHTTFTASFADLPPKTFRIENARFPALDLQSTTVTFGRTTPNERLIVMINFGHVRGYCGLDDDEDDRPRLNILFTRTEAAAAYQDRTNCRSSYRELSNAEDARD